MRPHLAALLLGSLGAWGCAHVAAPPPMLADEGERADGRVLVRLDAEAATYLSGTWVGPLPPRATLAALAVGAVARDAAVTAFGSRFRGGVEVEGTLPVAPGYRVLVEPRARNELSASLERQAPAASLDVRVTLRDARGTPVWQRSYVSGTLAGAAAFHRGTTGDRLTPAAQQVISALVERAAAEAAAEARRRPSS